MWPFHSQLGARACWKMNRNPDHGPWGQVPWGWSVLPNLFGVLLFLLAPMSWHKCHQAVGAASGKKLNFHVSHCSQGPYPLVAMAIFDNLESTWYPVISWSEPWWHLECCTKASMAGSMCPTPPSWGCSCCFLFRDVWEKQFDAKKHLGICGLVN